jgi:hypothetical protein
MLIGRLDHIALNVLLLQEEMTAFNAIIDVAR